MIKKILTKTIILTFIFSLTLTSANADYTDKQIADMYAGALEEQKTSFTDIDSVPWAVTPITELAKRGIVSGMGGGIFAPDKFVSRAEFIKMITGTCGIVDTKASSSYADVDQNHWAYMYVSSAKQSGLTDIYSNTLLNAGVAISREDICYMSVKALESAGINISVSSAPPEFTDEAQMSSYAKEAISKLAALGVINGRGNGIFSPKDSATRAESAKIIYNVLNLIEENF